jgi:aldehyde:ferredoxin oxidoreductase
MIFLNTRQPGRPSRDDFPEGGQQDRDLIRMFNNRKDLQKRRYPPYRTLNEPLLDGPAKGQRIGEENLNRMINEYYELRDGIRQEFQQRNHSLNTSFESRSDNDEDPYECVFRK